MKPRSQEIITVTFKLKDQTWSRKRSLKKENLLISTPSKKAFLKQRQRPLTISFVKREALSVKTDIVSASSTETGSLFCKRGV